MHDYQFRGADFIYDKQFAALFVDMGLGKTVMAATAMSKMLDDLRIVRGIVIAPKNVARFVWKQEFAKWKHLKDYKVNICWGTPEQRHQAVSDNHDVLVCTRDNIAWLRKHYPWMWDMCVFDESTSFKNQASVRFKALKKVVPKLRSSVILTGTPIPNGYPDLWSQFYLVDKGERLGRNITTFRRRYLKKGGFKGKNYVMQSEDKVAELKRTIADITVSMKAADYLEMPELVDVDYFVELDFKTRRHYIEMEKEAVTILTEGDRITAATAAIVVNKLQQFANGIVYDEWREAHNVHDEKIQALKDIVEDNPGENFLVAYSYQTDLERLKAEFPYAEVIGKDDSVIDRWNKGKIKMLIAHPASAGHGLNLQFGGNVVVWFGLNWSLELYMQFIKRLHRQGQMKPVRNIRIMARHTVDEDILKSINRKYATEQDLLDYVKESAVMHITQRMAV
jgi:SNF2 family DNA or RNA helicase